MFVTYSNWFPSNYPKIATLLKDLGAKVLYTKYLDISSNSKLI